MPAGIRTGATKKYERRMIPVQYDTGVANIEIMYNISYIILTNTVSRHLYQNFDSGNMLS